MNYLNRIIHLTMKTQKLKKLINHNAQKYQKNKVKLVNMFKKFKKNKIKIKQDIIKKIFLILI